MKIEATVECPVFDSFRVEQVRGMFDLSPAAKARETFAVDLPGLNEDWSIGLIVGPSGSGKSTVARQAFGEHVYQGGEWPADKAVVDCFGDAAGIRDITSTLSSVGFSSPPSWVKPYQVLSNGEKFRCDLARDACANFQPNNEGNYRPEAELARKRDAAYRRRKMSTAAVFAGLLAAARGK